jgi:hypothetical protein
MAKQALNSVSCNSAKSEGHFSMVTKSTAGNKPLSEFISRAAAARALRVTPFTIDRLVRSQSLPFFKVPGHNRLWIDRAAVMKLATAAAAGTVVSE